MYTDLKGERPGESFRRSEALLAPGEQRQSRARVNGTREKVL